MLSASLLAQKQPFDVQALMKIARIQEPQLSPDGQTVAFTVQTVDLAQAKSGAFAAVAVLGGGGRVRKPEAFADLPTFIGVGSEDFAKGGATGLNKALTDAGAKAVTFCEYPDVEHTVIVRAAVDDVFAAFDKAARQP